MSYNYEYLQDKDFLIEIDNLQIKEQYVKITALDFKTERPLESIEGKVISGNLSLDGKSSVRRTCNLTLFLDNTNKSILNVDNIISINKKIEVLIGFTNTTTKYKKYDIIWFPLGIYLIISPNISRSTQGLTISLQLKDKMCLLNGECGGTLADSISFHEAESEDENGNIITEYPTIFQIIQELVHHLGGEELHKIIISDIENKIKTPYRWIGSTPIWINEKGDYIIGEEGLVGYTKYEYGRTIGYRNTDYTYPGELISQAGDSICSVLDKIKNTLGNFEYFYDINGNFVFQEIKNYLNTTQAQITMDIINNDKLLKDNYKIDISKGKSAYLFNNSNLINAYSMAPSYNNIKNDFVVWGMKKTGDGQSKPIRFHLAIDTKPYVGYRKDQDGKILRDEFGHPLYEIYPYPVYEYLQNYDLNNFIVEKKFSSREDVARAKNKEFRLSLKKIIKELKAEEQYLHYGLYTEVTNEEGEKIWVKRDATEIILDDGSISLSETKWLMLLEDFKTTDLTTRWQDGKSFSAHPKYTNYFTEKFKAYMTKKSEDILNYALGIKNEDYAGVKIYLTNLYKTIEEEYEKIVKQITFIEEKLIYPLNFEWGKPKEIELKDWRTKLYLDGLVSAETLGEYSNKYYVELSNEWPRIYDIIEGKYIDEETIAMDYYLDFIDSHSDIGDLSIDNIGKRTKVISNDKINCLFEPDPPMDIILIKAGEKDTAQERKNAIKNKQTFIQISDDLLGNIASGLYYQSAYEEIKSLLQQYTAYNEAITLTAIPIYHLEPNIRITVEDEESGIGGDYMINRISLPLDVKGNMTINASKAIERY